MFRGNPFGFGDFDGFDELMRNLIQPRPPAPPKPVERVVVDVQALITKRVSHIRHGDKIYRIECTEYEVSR